MKRASVVIAIIISLLFLFLLFTVNVPPGQSPFPGILAILLVLIAQIGFWVIIVAPILVGAFWLAQKLGIQLPLRLEPKTPLDVLKMRYAKGEITREQFEQMKRDLEK